MTSKHLSGIDIDLSYAKRKRDVPLTYDWIYHTDNRQIFGDQSDFEVANRVRMLHRGELQHEAVVVGARDRIMALSKEVARLEREVARLNQKPELDLKKEYERLKQEYKWGNLTRLGVANHLHRAGYTISKAAELANRLPVMPHLTQIDETMVGS